MKPHSTILIILIIICANSFAQTSFRYKRNIGGVEETGWHAMTLPAEMFQHLNRDLNDLRLYSLDDGDTLEIPYLLTIQDDEVQQHKVELPLFNKSYRDGVLHLMFELQPSQKVNSLDLEFADWNFFGLVSMHGSDDKLQWFEVIKDQRIVSIKEGNGELKLSTVRFPVTTYRYLKIAVKSDVPLHFKNATFVYNNIKSGNFRDVPVTWKMNTDKKLRKSFVEIKAKEYVPVSVLHLQIDSDLDYYRSFVIEYVRDSMKTENGWVKDYHTLFEGHLTSFQANAFYFPLVFAKEMRLVINDQDNRSVNITRISAEGPEVMVISHLNPGNNVMLYGADKVGQPSYDLAHFTNKIPEQPTMATLGPSENIVRGDEQSKALFQDKLWLWGIMALMIGGLGVFTIKMMKPKGGNA